MWLMRRCAFLKDAIDEILYLGVAHFFIAISARAGRRARAAIRKRAMRNLEACAIYGYKTVYRGDGPGGADWLGGPYSPAYAKMAAPQQRHGSAGPGAEDWPPAA